MGAIVAGVAAAAVTKKVEYRGLVYYTDMPCKYLDQGTRLCTIYRRRKSLNPECAILTPALIRAGILPEQCPYLAHVEGGRGTPRHIRELPLGPATTFFTPDGQINH